METVENKLATKSRHKIISRILKFRWLLLPLFSFCIFIFISYGIIGITRGYSIQNNWPMFLYLAGTLGIWIVIILTVIDRKCFRGGAYLIYFLLLYLYAFTQCLYILQGRHYMHGKKYYEMGEYQKALGEFKKETESWYLHWTYNWNEANATDMIAKTYCQLGDFDKAKEIYKLIEKRFPRFYKKFARDDFRLLEEGLKKVAMYNDWVSGKGDFPWDLVDDLLKQMVKDPEEVKDHVMYRIALTYKYDLRCNAKALEVYREILNLDIPDRRKESARKRIKELEAVVQN